MQVFPLPQNSSSNANLNTATFDHHGILWFTGQSGVYGRLDPSTEKIQVLQQLQMVMFTMLHLLEVMLVISM